MKFQSKTAYVDSYRNRIKLVSEHDQVEEELRSDVKHLAELETRIQISIVNRDAKICNLLSRINDLRMTPKNYSFGLFKRKMRAEIVNEISGLQAQIDHLRRKRGRLFGNEMTIDECISQVRGFKFAAENLIYELNLECIAIERKRQERERKKKTRDALLAPYKRKIELGTAAMGKTRAVASVRKRKLKKSDECPYCGQLFGSDAGVADHIYPVARGGLSVTDNMVYICTPCNQKKSDRTLNEYIYKYRLDMIAIHKRLSKLGKRF